ncbi:expressed unknown protein [Seminavis robusta]|uniref:Uncharacterized protein n=1 Tax=Seminavis robusta TaxID=568900 RepID=A0A9N8EGG5_9STRA|nr:expressed unknown protein [Seminavis robusta]|eukprot:Sro1125_g243950.1 n/a (217) ;mRNA; r:25500-26150
MIPIAPITASLAPFFAPIAIVLSLTSAPIPSTPVEIPVLEVVKVYGRIAGPECYGMKAPSGSSCQVQLSDFKRALGLLDQGKYVQRDEFATRLDGLEFQWPLKPYGVDKSLSKTAVMNKGAETRVYMEELEGRGLYDRRNPTGPLPSSLRPAMNRAIQAEGLDKRAVDLVFRSFSSGSRDGTLSTEQIDRIFQGRDEMDYYDYLKIVGTDSVRWPN